MTTIICDDKMSGDHNITICSQCKSIPTNHHCKVCGVPTCSIYSGENGFSLENRDIPDDDILN